MNPKIEKLVAQARALSDNWATFYKQWIVRGLPVDIRYSRLFDSTMDEFSKRVLSGLELAGAIDKSDEETELLLLHRLDPVIKSIAVATASLTALQNQLIARPDAELKLNADSLDTLKVFSNGSHTENVPIGGEFDQLSAGVNVVIDFAFLGLKTRKVRSVGQFTELASGLVKTAAEAQAERAAVSQSLSEATAVVGELQGARAEAIRYLGVTEKAAADTEAARDVAAEVQNEAEAKLATIREVSKAAGALDTQVQAYTASFEGFQKSLDARVAQHTVFEKNMEAALLENQSREGEIDRLMKKSEDMIKGATTAGLGHSLEQTRLVYEQKMDGARTAFKWSIFALVVSAAPLLMHLFPGLFGAWVGTRPAVNPGELFNSGAAMELVGKMFLLFPATWMTQFFSKSYSEFFHLEREYAHKAALARAVEGFKKEAPKYEEEITTAVFLEVQSNPSKRAAPDAAEHPILGPVLRKFLDALPLPGKEKAKAD